MFRFCVIEGIERTSTISVSIFARVTWRPRCLLRSCSAQGVPGFEHARLRSRLAPKTQSMQGEKEGKVCNAHADVWERSLCHHDSLPCVLCHNFLFCCQAVRWERIYSLRCMHAELPFLLPGREVERSIDPTYRQGEIGKGSCLPLVSCWFSPCLPCTGGNFLFWAR